MATLAAPGRSLRLCSTILMVRPVLSLLRRSLAPSLPSLPSPSLPRSRSHFPTPHSLAPRSSLLAPPSSSSRVASANPPPHSRKAPAGAVRLRLARARQPRRVHGQERGVQAVRQAVQLAEYVRSVRACAFRERVGRFGCNKFRAVHRFELGVQAICFVGMGCDGARSRSGARVLGLFLLSLVALTGGYEWSSVDTGQGLDSARTAEVGGGDELAVDKDAVDSRVLGRRDGELVCFERRESARLSLRRRGDTHSRT